MQAKPIKTALWMEKLHQDGFCHLEKVVDESILEVILRAVECLSKVDASNNALNNALNNAANDTGTLRIAKNAGVRHLLNRSKTIYDFAKSGPIYEIASQILGQSCRPVKAILFDKTPEVNWFVTWHQDLTIAVSQKIDCAGFGPWSVKEELPHVQPPSFVLENMLSLRIRLDDCAEDNGAIKFIAGSHLVGIIDQSEIVNWRQNGELICPAAKGDVIAMRPLVLHSSSQSRSPEHRRVLHIEYAGCDLPCGLEWAEASGLDSVYLVLAIEEEFGLDIPNEDAQEIHTVGQMHQYLNRRLLKSSDDAESWCRLVDVIVRSVNVDRSSVTPEASFSSDLGVC